MTHLKENQPAPDINSKDQDSKPIRLSDFKGKKVILYFYPKDDTPGCTAESCNLRDHYEDLKKQGYEVLGVSNNDEKSHRKFIKKYDLPFHLIADTDKKVVHDYGVYGEKKFMGKTYMGIFRTTFIINEKGLISKIIDDVNTKEHTEQIMQ